MATGAPTGGGVGTNQYRVRGTSQRRPSPGATLPAGSLSRLGDQAEALAADDANEDLPELRAEWSHAPRDGESYVARRTDGVTITAPDMQLLTWAVTGMGGSTLTDLTVRPCRCVERRGGPLRPCRDHRTEGRCCEQARPTCFCGGFTCPQHGDRHGSHD